MPNDNDSKPLPTTIVGNLPPPVDIEIEDDEDERLDPIRVGSLPPPPHAIIHTHFTPDGKIIRCRCGWQSHECGTDMGLELEWLEHL